jgi:transposase
VSQSNGHGRICAGTECEVDLTGTHGKRKWCSESCRRRTEYTNVCACGNLVYDGSSTPDTVCGECKREAKYGESNARLREMWEAGEPTWYIAQELGRSESYITSWIDSRCRRYGEELPLRRLGGDAEEREARHRRMVALPEEGFDNTQIADAVGVASAAVVSMAFRCMKRKGWEVPPAPRAATPRVPDEDFIAAIESGDPYDQIAKHLGYHHPSSVYQRVRRLRDRGVLA